jgi:hypothetical protein
VEISQLVSRYQIEISDRRICASVSAPKTCSIERILQKTGRFQKWLQAKRLTPDLVQVSVGHGWNEGWQEIATHTSHLKTQRLSNLWVATPLGTLPQESPQMTGKHRHCIMIHNSNKITIME